MEASSKASIYLDNFKFRKPMAFLSEAVILRLYVLQNLCFIKTGFYNVFSVQIVTIFVNTNFRHRKPGFSAETPSFGSLRTWTLYTAFTIQYKKL